MATSVDRTSLVNRLTTRARLRTRSGATWPRAARMRSRTAIVCWERGSTIALSDARRRFRPAEPTVGRWRAEHAGCARAARPDDPGDRAIRSGVHAGHGRGHGPCPDCAPDVEYAVLCTLGAGVGGRGVVAEY